MQERALVDVEMLPQTRSGEAKGSLLPASRFADEVPEADLPRDSDTPDLDEHVHLYYVRPDHLGRTDG